MERTPTIEEIIARLQSEKLAKFYQDYAPPPESKPAVFYDVSFWESNDGSEVEDETFTLDKVKVVTGQEKMWVTFLYCLLTPVSETGEYGTGFVQSINDFISEDAVRNAWVMNQQIVAYQIQKLQNNNEIPENKIDTSKIELEGIDFTENKITLRFKLVNMKGERVSSDKTSLILGV